VVGTQFQYIDVGVNLDVTPHIHPDGDVTLKISLDVSSVTGYNSISGVSEPVIGQRKVEHEIRLKDSEVSLLGGMLEQQDIKSLSGIPGLAKIPILKYLFSETSTELKDNEVVFALVPHIVRLRQFDELNRKTLDVGTATSIHLRHRQNSALEPLSGARTAAKDPGETIAALEFDPNAVSVAKGEIFSVNVLLSGAKNVHTVPLEVSYDKNGLEIVNVSNGDLLSEGEEVVALVHRENTSSGTVEITASRPPAATGVSGHGVVTTLTFRARTAGRFPVKITKGALIQPDNHLMAVSGGETIVSVK
jgi:general secretion pathway protein D